MKTNNINNISFTNGNINCGLKAISKVLAVQEGGAGLSHIKFLQDSATGLIPKAVFARSKADGVENSFLELSESLLVYYCPTLIGERIFRKIYSKKLTPELQKQISIPAAELIKNSKNNKALMPVKAAIALGAFLIPLIEFTLNYIKNLMTLKVFKEGDFENIANLKKYRTENDKLNKNVQKSAKENILKAGKIYACCLGLGALFATRGKNSKILQNLSETILAPGSKLFKNKKYQDFVNKYFSIDFDNNKGKLAMSKGQLTSCVLVGGAGYFGASKDRGKQNFLETLFRYPLVGLYIIAGNELLQKGFKKLLYKSNKCRDIINSKFEVPKFADLKETAKAKCGNYNEIYKKMLKQKCLIEGVPLLFGIGVMGFFIIKSSNIFTRYRYNKEHSYNKNK